MTVARVAAEVVVFALAAVGLVVVVWAAVHLPGWWRAERAADRPYIDRALDGYEAPK